MQEVFLKYLAISESFRYNEIAGKMAEWSNAADSKSVIGLVSIWGSNPHLSAIE